MAIYGKEMAKNATIQIWKFKTKCKLYRFWCELVGRTLPQHYITCLVSVLPA